MHSAVMPVALAATLLCLAAAAPSPRARAIVTDEPSYEDTVMLIPSAADTGRCGPLQYEAAVTYGD